MSSWHEEAYQSPYKWAWRKQRNRELWRAIRRQRSGIWVDDLPGTCPSPRRGKHESRQPGTRGTCWVSSGEAKVDFKFNCNVFFATTQGALLSGLCACAGLSGSFSENELFPLERCQNKLARRLLALTRSNWDGEPNKQQTPIKVLLRKFGMCANCNGTQNPTLGMGQKSDRANPRRRPAPPASVGGNFWTDALGQTHPHDELMFHAVSWD